MLSGNEPSVSEASPITAATADRLCRKICEESSEARDIGGGCAHLCPEAAEYFVKAYILGTTRQGVYSTIPPVCPG